jgi:hypothetical protein
MGGGDYRHLFYYIGLIFNFLLHALFGWFGSRSFPHLQSIWNYESQRELVDTLDGGSASRKTSICRGQQEYRKTQAHIHVSNGIRTQDQISSGRSLRALDQDMPLWPAHSSATVQIGYFHIMNIHLIKIYIAFFPLAPLLGSCLLYWMEHRAVYSVSWSFTGGRTPWTGEQLVARPIPKHRTTQTQKNADTH